MPVRYNKGKGRSEEGTREEATGLRDKSRQNYPAPPGERGASPRSLRKVAVPLGAPGKEGRKGNSEETRRRRRDICYCFTLRRKIGRARRFCSLRG